MTNQHLSNQHLSNQHLAGGDIGLLVDGDTPARLAVQRLRNTLRLNAVTSLGGGLAAVAAAVPMSCLLGTGHAGWVRLVGIGLCLFAVGVLGIAGTRVSRLLRWAPVICVMDAAWVAASIATIGLGWYSTGPRRGMSSPTTSSTVALR